LLVVAIILTLTNVVAINDSRKFSWQADYAQQVRQFVDEQILTPAR